MNVDWDDLEEAFELTDSNMHSFLDRETGKVLWFSSEIADAVGGDRSVDSFPPWMQEAVAGFRELERDPDRYLEIPAADPGSSGVGPGRRERILAWLEDHGIVAANAPVGAARPAPAASPALVGAAERIASLAKDLGEAARHATTAAGHFARGDVPCGCAHVVALEGHLEIAARVLAEFRIEHAKKSTP